MINQFVLVGRLTKDVEINVTQNGKKYGKSAVAVNFKKDDTKYFNFSVFDTQCEYLNTYAKKGDMIALSGYLNQYQYTDAQGNKKSELQLSVNKAEIVGYSRAHAGQQAQNSSITTSVKDKTYRDYEAQATPPKENQKAIKDKSNPYQLEFNPYTPDEPIEIDGSELPF